MGLHEKRLTAKRNMMGIGKQMVGLAFFVSSIMVCFDRMWMKGEREDDACKCGLLNETSGWNKEQRTTW